MAKITFTIPDEKLDEFLEAFIAAEPIPSTISGEIGLTPGQWYREWVKVKTIQAYKNGRRKLTFVQIDENIIQ